MPGTKIALIGSEPAFQPWLFSILSDGGFIVDSFSGDDCDLLAISESGSYNLFILGTDSCAGDDENLLEALLHSGTFLFFDGGKRNERKNPAMGFVIDSSMSPEEIIVSVNDVIYKYNRERKWPRVRTNLIVDYSSPQGVYRSTLSSLSEKGAFICTLNPLPVQSLTSITIFLPEDSGEIKTGGRVLYRIGYDLERNIITRLGSHGKKVIGHPGMGVLFERISDPLCRMIRDFVEEVGSRL